MILDRYYTEIAAAFVRGKLEDAAGLSAAELVDRGLKAGLRMHKFKSNTELPRVKHVIGMLRGICPSSILDIGSGRGTFLWPLLAEFPQSEITSIDTKSGRVSDIDAVRKGGIKNLSASRMDAAHLSFVDKSFEATTALEVLEHVANPAALARETVRVTRRFVIASVPSHKDDNPEHIRLFDKPGIERVFFSAGASRLSVEYVRGHMIVLARM